MSRTQKLPEGVIRFVEETGAGTITRLERHVARREAWVVDVTRPDGSVAEYFLRLDRPNAHASDNPFSVARETRVLQALADTKVRVPAIHGWSEAHQTALQERVAGRPDLHQVPAEQQRPVFRHFMELVAELHALDPQGLGLDDFEWPKTPEDHALGEVVKLEGMLSARQRAARPEPLASFGAAWLRRHVPEQVERTVLLQGDTGPANFLFEGNEVTAIVDWEWAHFGDPMEDLGNICAREFFHPSGNLSELFEHYERCSGHPVALDRVRYYRVQQMVRSVIGLVHVTEPHDPGGPVAMNLAYRVVCQRALCEAMAEAAGVPLEAAELPDASTASDSGLHAILVQQLENEIAPALEAGYLRHRAESAAGLAACLENEARLGPALEAVECEEMAELLGERPASLSEGLTALDAAAVLVADEAQEALWIRYLARRANRAEALYAPIAGPFADRRFSAID